MQLKKIFSKGMFRQSIFTLSATITNGALGAVFFILTARALGSVEFGLLIISITILTLVADIADIGTDTGLVKFVSKYIKSESEKAYRFVRLIFLFNLLMPTIWWWRLQKR